MERAKGKGLVTEEFKKRIHNQKYGQEEKLSWNYKQKVSIVQKVFLIAQHLQQTQTSYKVVHSKKTYCFRYKS